MTDIEKALGIAQKIGNAIVKKFPKHELFVRRTDLGGAGFIEIALRPEGGTYLQETTVAYSDEYYVSASPEQLRDKAMAILADFKASMGVV